MEWAMAWKDVPIGFTVAGIIAAFVPKKFQKFVGSGSLDLAVWEIIVQPLVSPLPPSLPSSAQWNIPLADAFSARGRFP